MSRLTAEAGGMAGRVEAVNVGLPRAVDVNGRRVLTAIWKEPVAGRVPLAE